MAEAGTITLSLLAEDFFVILIMADVIKIREGRMKMLTWFELIPMAEYRIPRNAYRALDRTGATITEKLLLNPAILQKK